MASDPVRPLAFRGNRSFQSDFPILYPSVGTAIQALYMRLGLSLPNSPSKDGEPILVWGGSTSVGLYALQLLKASGYTPISVSSPKNFDLVKKFGAAAVFDCEPSDAVPLSLSLLDDALRHR